MKQKSPIKEKFKSYRKILEEIEIEEQRCKVLQDDNSITGRRSKAGIKDHLRELLSKENAEYEELVAIINALPCVDQRQVVLARYIDGMAWGTITAIIFGKREDFDDKQQSYQRRIYRIHGNALANANRIIKTRDE